MPDPLSDRRFDGFRKTPFLWKAELAGLRMHSSDALEFRGYPEVQSSKHIRLGKLTEQFVTFELEQDPSVEILASNIQVFQDQITIGELDCLIKKDSTPIHLELVYKFYLYDPSFPEELHRWIGPNRKDSMVQKLKKLKEKQLPLLYRPETTEAMKKLGVSPIDFSQQLYFKAQLFIPHEWSVTTLPLVN